MVEKSGTGFIKLPEQQIAQFLQPQQLQGPLFQIPSVLPFQCTKRKKGNKRYNETKYKTHRRK